MKRCCGRIRRLMPASRSRRRAFAATVTTGWAINELRSAGALRERYVGEWLPEPIITDGHDDPAWHAEMADSLSLAMLVPAAPAPVPAGRAALMSWEQATPAIPALPWPPWHPGETVGRQLHRGSCRRCIGSGLRQNDAAPPGGGGSEHGQEIVEGLIGSQHITRGLDVHDETADDGEHEGA